MYGLYIHIPFCIKKCRYCDFISFSGCEHFFDSYIEALCREMQEYSGYKIDSVFIGGGTPTILSASQLEKLLSYIKETFSLENAEISIESNPKTLTEEKLCVLKAAGVNRISIGVQSFIDEELSLLGRVHTAEEAIDTIRLAKKFFDNINLDLMFALPHQTLENVKQTLSTALSLSPTHLSCYSLIIEEGTEFYKEYEMGRLDLPSEDTDRNAFRYICKTLNENGYNRYEISNFAKPGFECRHNLKYWSLEEYIGIGVAAHSYLDNQRFFNTSSLDSYLSGSLNRETIMLSKEDLMSEYMIMGLRKTEGINTNKFKTIFGDVPDNIYNTEKFKKLGLMEQNGDFLRLTDYGLDVSNSILCEFV